ncbi:unnamed protein product [Schistosoma curassoni]|uniref:SH2 domain-containing protein n=1 Tax=Schistosoma curassoni TaxID=6186 RepID=A0A183JPG1_9TREM|nr:unnamed protein product [Schistosoma curassoni]
MASLFSRIRLPWSHINLRIQGLQFEVVNQIHAIYHSQNIYLVTNMKSLNIIFVQCTNILIVLLFYSWFHGKITGKEAEKMLLERGKPDCFLVRESVHRPGSYVLSVLTGEQVAHIMIHGKPNGMYDVGGGHQFSSLKELIDFYTNTPMVEKNGGLVSLKQVNQKLIYSPKKSMASQT